MVNILRVTAGFRRQVDEIWALLRYSRVNKSISSSISWPLKIGPIDWPETSVTNYNYTLCNIPEDDRSHLT